MACHSGFGDVITHPTDRFSKSRSVRGRFPVCLRLAQIAESAMWISSFHIAGNGATEGVDLENQSRHTQDFLEDPGQRRPDVVHAVVVSGARVFEINRALFSVIPGQRSLYGCGASRCHLRRYGSEATTERG